MEGLEWIDRKRPFPILLSTEEAPCTRFRLLEETGTYGNCDRPTKHMTVLGDRDVIYCCLPCITKWREDDIKFYKH